MRHYVHAADGTKYGPADVALLLQWKAEGRLSPESLLEPEVGGTPYEARTLPELYPELQERESYGQSDFGYVPYPHQTVPVDNSKKLAMASLLSGGASIFCCPIGLGIVSLVCAVMAHSRGNPLGKWLIVYAVSCAAIGITLNVWALNMLKEMGFPV